MSPEWAASNPHIPNADMPADLPWQLIEEFARAGRMHAWVDFSPPERRGVERTWQELAGREYEGADWVSDVYIMGEGDSHANCWISTSRYGHDWHLPCFDVDVPRTRLVENDVWVATKVLLPYRDQIRWVASSTPGHHHVYVDVPMPWTTYVLYLQDLAKRQVIQEGYFRACTTRGYSVVRKPGVSKFQQQEWRAVPTRISVKEDPFDPFDPAAGVGFAVRKMISVLSTRPWQEERVSLRKPDQEVYEVDTGLIWQWVESGGFGSGGWVKVPF